MMLLALSGLQGLAVQEIVNHLQVFTAETWFIANEVSGLKQHLHFLPTHFFIFAIS